MEETRMNRTFLKAVYISTVMVFFGATATATNLTTVRIVKDTDLLSAPSADSPSIARLKKETIVNGHLLASSKGYLFTIIRSKTKVTSGYISDDTFQAAEPQKITQADFDDFDGVETTPENLRVTPRSIDVVCTSSNKVEVSQKCSFIFNVQVFASSTFSGYVRATCSGKKTLSTLDDLNASVTTPFRQDVIIPVAQGKGFAYETVELDPAVVRQYKRRKPGETITCTEISAKAAR
jgi:hypothetical protein